MAERYMRRLLFDWSRSPHYIHLIEEEVKNKPVHERIRLAMLARISFLVISFMILVGCNSFRMSSQTIAFETGEGKIWYILAYVMKAAAMIFYWKLTRMDPGFLATSEDSHLVGAESQQRRDFCKACNILQPQRAKHCKICGRCVARFDHHCPFVANCIGARTHWMFWLFLALEVMPSLVSARLAWSVFSYNRYGMNPFIFPVQVLFCLFVWIFTLFACVMLFAQTINILCGRTSFECLLHTRVLKYSAIHEELTGVEPPMLFFSRLCYLNPLSHSQGLYNNLVVFFCEGVDKDRRWFEYDPDHLNWYHTIPSPQRKKVRNAKGDKVKVDLSNFVPSSRVTPDLESGADKEFNHKIK